MTAEWADATNRDACVSVRLYSCLCGDWVDVPTRYQYPTCVCEHRHICLRLCIMQTEKLVLFAAAYY